MNTAETRNDWVGRVIDGRFPLLEWLGATEQSAVFRTELNGPQPQRAVIRLVAPDRHAEERLRDWKQSAALSHPHLMRILDSGRTQAGSVDLLYVVTEYAEESLAQVIPERPLTAKEAEQVLGPVLDGLAYLHSRGMVHGRIKPSNIIVVGDRIKLPVESVRHAGPIDPPKQLQIHDAPEVASGTIQPASDIWSLGVTLIEALTQHPPAWERVPAEVPEPFAAVARACLLYDAGKRATLTEIKRLLRPSPSLEEPANEFDQLAPAAIDRPELLRETPSRTRFAAVAAAAIVILAAIVYLLTRSPHSPAPAPTVATPPPPPAVAPVPAPPISSEAAPHGGGTVKGEIAERVMPAVSEAANRTIHGKVDVGVRAHVSSSGAVEDARVESGGHSRYYTAKALDAARKWRFKPAQQDGRAVPSVWDLRFQFRRNGPEVHAVEVSP